MAEYCIRSDDWHTIGYYSVTAALRVRTFNTSDDDMHFTV